MIKKLLVILLITPHLSVAKDPPAVGTRLAKIVEAVVSSSGLSSINISATTKYSVNINKIDGVDVCDPASATKARKLQEAFDAYPGIGDDFGPAFFSVLNKDGERRRIPLAEAVKRGLVKGCTNVYVSVVRD